MRYLILTYYKKADGKIDESMAVSRRIGNKDLQSATVILDFKKLSVIKASMDGVQVPKNFDRIVQYYMLHYESTITRLFKENGYEVTLEKSQAQPQQADPS